jgi:hypothetical protein
MEGWTCSQCSWTFTPDEELYGANLDEMKRNFERDRDKQFKAHRCAEYPGVGFT